MYARNVLDTLNDYENNFGRAYMEWYEGDLPDFLEPIYDPSSVVADCPEVDWYRSEKMNPDMFVMRDGSMAWVTSSGTWVASRPSPKVA